jgi:hypothetical protein
MPLEARAPSQKEIDTRPELENAKRLITRGTLYEYSVCALPCNPNALAEAVAKGLEIPETIAELLGINTKDVPAEIVEEAETIIKGCIVWDADDYKPDAIVLPKVCRPVDVEEKLQAIAKRIAKVRANKINPDEIVRRIMGKL